uniref:Uncharacterized protein n=1 Tax=viral metagenome TaxID=1070528 RepID=A0A6C0BR03_9ZZZZ
MERGIVMVIHSAIIGLFVYGILMYVGNKQAVAENRSIILSAVVLIYMILFGHGLPVKLNRNV